MFFQTGGPTLFVFSETSRVRTFSSSPTWLPALLILASLSALRWENHPKTHMDRWVGWESTPQITWYSEDGGNVEALAFTFIHVFPHCILGHRCHFGHQAFSAYTGDAICVQKLNKEAKERYPPKPAQYSGINPSNQMRWTDDLNQIAQVTLPDVCVPCLWRECVHLWAILFLFQRTHNGWLDELQLFHNDKVSNMRFLPHHWVTWLLRGNWVPQFFPPKLLKYEWLFSNNNYPFGI